MGKLFRTSLRDHPAAGSSGSRPHFDDPVRLCKNLRIVIHQHHRISIGNQILHHAGQPHDIGGMQTDGRLIQHIQDARGAVPDSSCQLHPLPLSGGQSGCSTVQRQIAEPQIQKPFCRGPEGFTDALRHGTHLLRQALRHAVHPVCRCGKGHLAGLRQGNALQPRRPCRFRQSGTAAVRTHILLQKFLHPLHALFILYLCQGIFHRIDRVEIGEVQLSRLIGVFGMI